MARSGRISLILLAALLLTPLAQAGQTVLLVSIDGFRADYLDRGVTPTLSALAAVGVRAVMRPAFTKGRTAPRSMRRWQRSMPPSGS